MKGEIKMQNVLRFDHQLTPCYNNELFGTDILTGDQILHVLKLEKKIKPIFHTSSARMNKQECSGMKLCNNCRSQKIITHLMHVIPVICLVYLSISL